MPSNFQQKVAILPTAPNGSDAAELIAAAPAPRPVWDRARDHAAVFGACGALTGACVAARNDAPVLVNALQFGMPAALTAATFVGLRHALLQGQWEQDREAVSGLAAGALGVAIGSMRSPAWGARLGAASFVGGSLLHYAHRWWLRSELERQLAAPPGAGPRPSKFVFVESTS